MYVEKSIHKGWLLGVPVYADMQEPDCPTIWGRNRLFDALLRLAEDLHGLTATVCCFIWADFEPMYRLKITAEIRWLEHVDDE